MVEWFKIPVLHSRALSLVSLFQERSSWYKFCGFPQSTQANAGAQTQTIYGRFLTQHSQVTIHHQSIKWIPLFVRPLERSFRNRNYSFPAPTDHSSQAYFLPKPNITGNDRRMKHVRHWATDFQFQHQLNGPSKVQWIHHNGL